MYAIEGIQGTQPPFSLSRARGAADPDPAVAMRILLVEDNDTDAELIGNYIRSEAYLLCDLLKRVCTLAEAFQWLQSEEVEIILLDLSLPDTSGFETFELLHQKYPEIPIIVLTGEIDERIALRTLKAGAQDYISKEEVDSKIIGRALRYTLERHQLQRKLNDAYRRQLLSQKLESMGLIAGGVAHDFNNLLAGVSGNAELAQMHADMTPALAQYLQNVVTGCKRGGELCNQLMAYSGKGHLELKVCDLNDMIDELHPLLNVSVLKTVQLEYALDRGIPTIEVDSSQIRQVIMNLITNAADAMENAPGEIVIETGAFRLDPIFMEGNFWASEGMAEWQRYNFVKVEDQGCGMSQETVSRIFDPFFTTKFSGRGLGLAAALGIIQAHSGGIRVESTLGQGTAVWLLLPCSNKPKTVRPEDPQIEKDWDAEGTILIADDESELLEALGKYHQRLGFKTLLASDGKEALKVFREHSEKVDLVLLDMTMPRMCGKELHRKIMETHPSMPAIIMSGYSEKKIEGDFRKNESLAFIKKPFRFADLKKIIRKMLGSKGK